MPTRTHWFLDYARNDSAGEDTGGTDAGERGAAELFMTNPPSVDTTLCCMEYSPADVIHYKRSRFQTRLPRGRLYTQSHAWLIEAEPGLWRVGLTRFATRMLGEIVEQGIELKTGDAVAVGQLVGWLEGFKARSDVYCVASGIFAGGNPELDCDPTRIDKDPYYAGWLYQVRGLPEPNALQPEQYIQLLDGTIDKMMGKGE